MARRRDGETARRRDDQRTKWRYPERGRSVKNDKSKIGRTETRTCAVGELIVDRWSLIVDRVVLSCVVYGSCVDSSMEKAGPCRRSNPGPLAPKARIIPLDHRAASLAKPHTHILQTHGPYFTTTTTTHPPHNSQQTKRPRQQMQH